MIIKSMSRKASQKSSFRQLVSYVARYAIEDKKNQEKEEATIILRHNLRSRSIENIIDEFIRNESFRLYRRKDAVVLYHDILSLSPKSESHITDYKLKQIAKKYVVLRAPNCLTLVVAHRGKTKHSHLHCVVSGVALNGRSSRVSKAQFKHIKLELERFQREKFPELEHSTIEHEPIRTRQKSLEDLKKSRQTNKETILRFLEQTASKAKSQDEFLTHFKGKKYEPYYRNGHLQGIISQGQKYRFTRLGFDTEKLNELDERHQEEIQLMEIKSIRQKKSTELVKEEKTQDTKILQELTSIRRRSNQRELTGRSLELMEK